MSVSAECYYQPLVNIDFDEDSEQMELGLKSEDSYPSYYNFLW